MPWHCPACNSIITHSEVDPRPRTGERYRCHVCRLTLEFDADADKLTIAPLEADHHVESKPARTRVIPPAAIEAKPKKPEQERRRVIRRKADRQALKKKKARPKHK